jgi:hypothetical protein
VGKTREENFVDERHEPLFRNSICRLLQRISSFSCFELKGGNIVKIPAVKPVELQIQRGTHGRDMSPHSVKLLTILKTPHQLITE